MRKERAGASQRDTWACAVETRLLVGGANFSEWATLMSYEAHTAFVAGADIATVILCSSTCETYLRTETNDNKSNFHDLIVMAGFGEELTKDVHWLRKARNGWAHALISATDQEPLCYTEIYDNRLEADAMRSYEIMLRVLLGTPWV